MPSLQGPERAELSLHLRPVQTPRYVLEYGSRVVPLP